MRDEKVREEEKGERELKGGIVAGSDEEEEEEKEEKSGEAPSPTPSGVIGSWTANLSRLNQQQQR